MNQNVNNKNKFTVVLGWENGISWKKKILKKLNWSFFLI